MNLKSENGITIITLVITIIVMGLISFGIYANMNDISETTKIMNFNNDLSKLKEKTIIYYAQNNKLPIVGSEKTSLNIGSTNPDDGDKYYEINIDSDGLNIYNDLNYGKKQASDDDIYIINEKSHTIYYLKGIYYDGSIHYTNEDFASAGINQVIAPSISVSGTKYEETNWYNSDVNINITVQSYGGNTYPNIITTIERLYTDEQSGETVKKVIANSENRTDGSYSIVLTEDGIYTITSYCKNGNDESIHKNVQVNIDKSAPVINNIKAKYTKDGVQINVDAVDTVSGIRRYEYIFDGQDTKPVIGNAEYIQYCEVPGENDTLYIQKSDLSDGIKAGLVIKNTIDIEVCVTNNAGKKSTKKGTYSCMMNPTQKELQEIYGASVSNYYIPNTTTDVGWKIFYADESNIYLIADNYIEPDNFPESTNAAGAKTGRKPKIMNSKYDRSASFLNIINDYSGTDRVKEEKLRRLNKSYFDQNISSKNRNIKSVAYMMDTTAWNSKFRDSNNKAEYVIGSPTLEMLINSYNSKYGENIQTRANEIGYQINKYGSWEDYTGYLKKDSLYVIEDETNALEMWLASPSAYQEEELLMVNFTGYINIVNFVGTGGYAIGFRPVVCLNSDVILKRNVDNTYTIQ